MINPTFIFIDPLNRLVIPTVAILGNLDIENIKISKYVIS